MKKAYYFSTRQIVVATALIVVAILVVGRLVHKPGGRGDADPLNPTTPALMQARGGILMAELDKAVANATAAMSTPPAANSPIPVTGKQDAGDSNAVWQPAATDAGDPKIPLSDRISVYQRVQVNPRPADLPIAGEQVTLPMFNGKKWVAEVQTTTVSPNGDYTWRGHLVDHGDDYPVVMTYGEHSTFATITTPDGAYTLESVDGLGWLYKNPSFPELSAPGTNDFLEVDPSSH